MKEKFTLRHDENTKGHAMTFTPFGEGKIKAKDIAIRFRKFMRNHISSTQYDEILKQLSKDMKVVSNLPDLEIARQNMMIVPKDSGL